MLPQEAGRALGGAFDSGPGGCDSGIVVRETVFTRHRSSRVIETLAFLSTVGLAAIFAGLVYMDRQGRSEEKKPDTPRG